ncbi:hypothetical protein [Phaeobacter porticola]|uniref:Low-complexity protein n=1 Tax=Phaeobacter porticola TaxID=1844006 RepID=A0A1L3I7W6_9RHOB|nr:hypothetical protein [Phaeobacter porticola]APG48092.1 hypothetical protein PhaeoP97_02715 [Phaeobacter porticola]
MLRFQSWEEIEPTATEAERKLKAAVEAGEFCRCGPDGQTPPEPDDWSNLPSARHIRADVLRFFLLGGCTDATVTEIGVLLTGAFVSGELSLIDCEVARNLMFHNCVFQHGIYATRCTALKNVALVSCKLPYLEAAGLKTGGQLSCIGTEFKNEDEIALDLQGADIGHDLFLRSAKIFGEADLNGLKTGGQLSCIGTEFKNKDGKALNLQNADIGQSLFLSSAKIFGEAYLIGLKTGGHLDCTAAEFQNKDGRALNLQNANIARGFIFRDQTAVQGVVDLNAARCGELVDDPDCWPDDAQNGENLILDGFTYHRIFGPTDARTRLNWLARGDTWRGEFFPQPYKQLAKVLHDMGHETDATKVRVALGKKLRHHARKERIANAKHPIQRLWAMATTPALLIWHSLSLLLTGHGFRPERSLIALVLLWGLATLPAHLAWEEGSFAPNSAVALQSGGWATYHADDNHPPHPNPAKDWSLTSTIGRDWESFNRYAYAADLVVPIIDLGQTDAWAPSTTRGPWGWHLWWARWVFTLAGWIVTALGAAALTGIIRRE